MEPNDFFGGGINQSSLLDSGTDDHESRSYADNQYRSRTTSENLGGAGTTAGGCYTGDEESEDISLPVMN